MVQDNNEDKPKLSVKTPWGTLVKSKAYEEQFIILTQEISKLTNRLQELEQSTTQPIPDLPSLPLVSGASDHKINDLEQRVGNLETELRDIKEKLDQIKEKFAILGQQIIKKMT